METHEYGGRALLLCAAVALTVAGCGQARGSATTTSPTASMSPSASPSPSPSPSPFAGVDWSSLTYPVNCGGPTLGSLAARTTPQPGLPIAVVFATCRTAAGSPPSAVLVYDTTGPGGAPHLRETLLSYQDDWLPRPDGTQAGGDHLAVAVYGYSASSIPRCCPDIHTTLAWTWSQGGYVPGGAEPPHETLPPA